MNNRPVHRRNTLQASERLKLRKQIEMLFQNGEAFSVYPLLVKFHLVSRSAMPDGQGACPVRVGFSIPKKKIRHAHNRNRNRRLLKEAWRCQKHELYAVIPGKWQLHCFLVFKGSEMLTFEQATTTIRAIHQKLVQKVVSLQEQERS
ncbi:MAG TPA: ribonuclease P protein component [Edaphocola sp.]|nr:ribonuclease P protein component [Edaphocola sp.]